jgi:leucyl-tRNA synthetase
MEVEFAKIEEKWQKKWDKAKLFEVSENSKKKKFYLLEMFPYPSGSGLHMGHALNYAIGDVLARYKIMNGFNVLHPMGYDALGLPAENAAILAGEHPQDYTDNSIKNFTKQFKSLGLTYDWTRVVNTADPSYYKWDQWIFLKMFEKGLVYQNESAVNWCPKCDTVLANEQVQNGMCWRHDDTEVEIKSLKQWFLKITDYAGEIYDEIDNLDDWPSKTKAMQKNWIKKKKWIDIDYELDGAEEKITVSTTRPDTNFGATFVVMAPEHPLLSEERGLVPKEQRQAVSKYIAKAKEKTSEERIEEGRKKTGVFSGLYCVNPLTEKKMPIWITDFVLMDVGTGVVVGVPGHDIRDFEFAKEFGIPVVRVVVGSDGDKSEITKTSQVQEEEGTMINSGFLDGMNIHDATTKIMDYLEEKGWGRRTTRFRLRDWGISRQRYWGTPIPMIHCVQCGAVPVKESDLPIALPKDVKFGKGNPLETNEKWIKTTCPKCGGKGRRETDTMDTFVNSSWYFLRYTDAQNDKNIFDSTKANYWAPVDQYIGGVEHACMHLIYFRFYTKFLADLGLINFREPAKKLFHQGMLGGEGGIKMSKSKGNVVVPEVVSEKYGIDTARLFLLSLAAPDKPRDWSEKGIQGSLRIIERIMDYFENFKEGKDSPQIKSKLNKTIRDVSSEIEEFKYNSSIIKIRKLFEYFENETTSKDTAEKFLKILSPFCPHIAEELWEKIGNKEFISNADWPKYNEKLIDESLEKIEEVVSNVRLDILKIKELAKLEKVSKVKMFVSPDWKWAALAMIKDACKAKPDFGLAMKTLMANDEMKKHGKEVQPFLKAVMNRFGELQDLEKFDEVSVLGEAKIALAKEFGEIEIVKAASSNEAKARNAFPGKPALLVE